MGKSTFIIICFLIAAPLWAQTTTLQTQVSTNKSLWSGFASIGYSSNLYEKDSPNAEAFGSASLLVNYRYTGENLIRGSLSGFKEQNNGQETKLNDGYIGWVNNGFWRKGEILTIGQQIRGVFPSSKDSRVRDEKILGASVIPSFIFNLTPVGVTGVTLVYQPQMTKNFHKLEQNRLYQNNTSYGTNQILAIAWSITDHLYIQPVLVYGLAWSYGGVRRDDVYQFQAEVGYNFKSGIILAGGLTNAGAIRNLENGNDQTIRLYNNQTASTYMDLTYAF